MVSQPNQYLAALNKANAEEVMAQYADNAVVIRPEKAIQGKEAIREWMASQFETYVTGSFSLLSESQDENVYSFHWEAQTATGATVRGHDTQGLVDSKISYHYAFTEQI